MVSMDNRGTLVSGVSVLSAGGSLLQAGIPLPSHDLRSHLPGVSILKGLQFLGGTREIPTPSFILATPLLLLPEFLSVGSVHHGVGPAWGLGYQCGSQTPARPWNRPPGHGAQGCQQTWQAMLRTADRPVLSVCRHLFISLLTPAVG